MSKFNGRINPINAIKGKIAKKQEIKADVSRIGGFAGAISQEVKVKGSIKSVERFGGAIKQILILYRWIEARKNLVSARKTTAISAPAQTMEKSTFVCGEKKADAIARPTSEMDFGRNIIASTNASPKAYIRSALNVFKMMVYKHELNMQTAEAVILEAQRAMYLATAQTVLSAPSVDGKSSKCITQTGFNKCENAAAQNSRSDNVALIQKSMSAEAAKMLQIKADKTITVSNYAKAITWGYEVINGVLRIPYSYQAEQQEKTLVIGTICKDWLSPHYDENGNLIIRQARLINQSKNILEVV